MDSVKRLTGDISAVHQTAEKTAKLNPFPQRSFLDDFCGRLNQNLKEPTSDIVDGELSESKDFVQILIGPTNEISTLAKQSVWNRPYWRDPRRGINHFDMNEDGIWELRHPGLDEIESEDFVFVAEYLESGDFGYRRPQGGEDMEEAVAQCMSAWFAAERLDMSDLMDYIVEKLQKRIEPAMYDVMVFACQIYNSPDTGLPSYQWLKDYLATSIAENYWIYLSDDHLSSSFIEKLQLFPELERDIYMRRLVALEQRLEPEDDDQNEGDAEMS
ncbi:hypothetical protein BDW02DRAFT_546657 [Decorospora gaudefroyi]|uniref:Uncharacterized protein n=1 Tax=Decorospora gaudefroyi TaxID=184978 RepID=A0A6A5KGH8_9PLEO|nr:hypothetical protein BDW02DRAFT_546657 [Decorospora gaudefroyi]